MANEEQLPMIIDNKVIDSKTIKQIQKLHKDVSKIKTPKSVIKKKEGFDYVKRHYMKNIADKYFPGWNWIIIKSEALGSDAYVVHGRLIWQEFGVTRYGDMVAAHRIQKLKNRPGFVDIGNDVKSANTDCMKKAFNVYMNIADDIYKMSSDDLDEKHINKILDLAKEIGDEFLSSFDISYYSIKRMIEEGEITPTNYKKTIERLEEIKEKQNNG